MTSPAGDGGAFSLAWGKAFFNAEFEGLPIVTRLKAAPMSETEYDAAVAEFIRNKGVTRCPTACVAPTNATVAETERAALRTHEGAREAARLEKLNSVQQTVFSFPGPRSPILSR